MKRFVGPLLILLCTVIWGSAFVAQKFGSEHFGPFALTSYRNLLGGAFLFLFTLRSPRVTRAEALGGTVSGLVLFLAMVAQQIGIETTTPGVSAFLTANYVLIVPVIAWLTGRGRSGWSIWVSAAVAIVGSFLLCLSGSDETIGFGRGESWTLLCAVLFAVQIMTVDRFARRVDVVRFSMVQLFAAGLFAIPFVALLPSESSRLSWAEFVAGLPALAYVGVLSSGIAYTLQNLGQSRTPPALAAIIMAMESVFGAFFGWLVLHDVMTARQLLGCVLVFSAVLFSQGVACVRDTKVL